MHKKNDNEKRFNKGYFKCPNFVFDLGLSLFALLVLLNLLRRSNKKGECFPSLRRIRQDTGIKAENTIRKGLKELKAMNLITTKERTGVSTVYKLSSIFYGEILQSDYENTVKDARTPSQNEGVTPSSHDVQPLQEMKPKYYKTSKTNLLKESFKIHRVQDGKKFETDILNENENIKFDRKAILARSKLRSKNFPAGKKNKAVDELAPWEIRNAESELEEIKRRNERDKPEVYNT